MSVNVDDRLTSSGDELREISAVNSGGLVWTMHHYARAESTNDIARNLGSWNAVRADLQTKGRGRFGRSFSSVPGGLWISAVIPMVGDQAAWTGFSLRVGASLLSYIKTLGLPRVRLRWPNDLMIENQKLAGLLIEQTKHSLIVGFGLNIFNEPWVDDPSLKGITTSLSAHMHQPPSIAEAAEGVLCALADAHQKMILFGMTGAIEELNREWVNPMPVEIHLSDGKKCFGLFQGLDLQGNLILRNDAGEGICVEHQMVERLKELMP